jgi:DNA-binding NarL/FixJ family response regulator
MNPPRPIQILIADDHDVVRAGLRALVGRYHDLAIVGEATTTDELLREAARLSPDVLVVDLRMPGHDVFEVIETLRETCPETKIVVFTAYDEARDAARAIRAGAHGFVLKQAPGGDVVEAIRRVRAGRRYVDDAMAARMMQVMLDAPEADAFVDAPPLSEREARVLDLLARGYTGPQIAVEMGVRVGTVESYRHRIRKKLGLKSRAEITQFVQAGRLRTRERRRAHTNGSRKS